MQHGNIKCIHDKNQVCDVFDNPEKGCQYPNKEICVDDEKNRRDFYWNRCDENWKKF